jgi:hypothetical protein
LSQRGRFCGARWRPTRRRASPRARPSARPWPARWRQLGAAHSRLAHEPRLVALTQLVEQERRLVERYALARRLVAARQWAAACALLQSIERERPNDRDVSRLLREALEWAEATLARAAGPRGPSRWRSGNGIDGRLARGLERARAARVVVAARSRWLWYARADPQRSQARDRGMVDFMQCCARREGTPAAPYLCR